MQLVHAFNPAHYYGDACYAKVKSKYFHSQNGNHIVS